MARRKSAIRTRQIRPGFWDNEDLVELGSKARLLFAGLWCLADRDGRLEDRPRRIRNKLLMLDVDNIDDLLAGLADIRVITRYSVENVNYIQVNNFANHQSVHPKEAPGEIPPNPAEFPGKSRNSTLGPSGPSGPSGPCKKGTTVLNTEGSEPSPNKKSKQTPSQMIQDMAYTRDKVEELRDRFGNPPWTPDQITEARAWLEPLKKYSETDLALRRTRIASEQRNGGGSPVPVGDVIVALRGSEGP